MVINDQLTVLTASIKNCYPQYKYAIWVDNDVKESHYIIQEEGPPVIVISNELPIQVACQQVTQLYLSLLITVYNFKEDLNKVYDKITNDFNRRMEKGKEDMSRVLNSQMKIYMASSNILH